MRKRLPNLLIVLALDSSIGLHWAPLQSVAWVGMIVRYSQQTTLVEALVKTFDGQHPCFLCKQISEGKKAEKKTERFTALKQLEYTHAVNCFVFSPPSDFRLGIEPSPNLASIAHTPPVPPPRLVAA